jgi:hypothetical protein
MTKEEARFHLIMAMSRHSQRAANKFERRFHHEPRERSSHKAEMKEINEFWHKELQRVNPVVAKLAMELPVDRGIDVWIKHFERDLMDSIVTHWG